MMDKWFKWLCKISACLVVAMLVGIITLLLYGSLPTWRHFGWQFLFQRTWNPVTHVFGAVAPLWGTVVSSMIALTVALPLSFGLAVFIEEQAPAKLRPILASLTELMAGIPSIIYGMWGLFVFAPFFASHIQLPLQSLLNTTPFAPLVAGSASGIGLLTAGLILAFMILPYITAMARDIFSSVPPMLKESAYGLGATRWEVLRRITIPATRAPLVGAILLGLGRALGETMAVTFVIGNAYQVNPSLFEPANTITSALTNEFSEAEHTLHLASLTALGLLLFGITLVVLLLSHRWRRSPTA
jgi:phosphate transport system permease protein